MTITHTPSGFITDVTISEVARDYRQYGGNLRTRFTVKCADNRTRRVYVMSYGNSASLYLRIGGVDTFLSIEAESQLEAAVRTA